MTAFSVLQAAAAVAGLAIVIAALAVLECMRWRDGRWCTAGAWIATALASGYLAIEPSSVVTPTSWPAAMLVITLAVIAWINVQALREHAARPAAHRIASPLVACGLLAGCIAVLPVVSVQAEAAQLELTKEGAELCQAEGGCRIFTRDALQQLISRAVARLRLRGVTVILENQRAFLALIEHAEGTGRNPATCEALDPYRTCYGYRHVIRSFENHPAVTREWSGEVLPESLCRKAGIAGVCRSTAAGRYQLIRKTWLGIKERLRLPDFSPESQDRAALYLIANRGALEDVHAGRVRDAIQKCRAEWASLPGAGYGQPERRLSELVAAFTQAGGTLA